MSGLGRTGTSPGFSQHPGHGAGAARIGGVNAGRHLPLLRAVEALGRIDPLERRRKASGRHGGVDPEPVVPERPVGAERNESAGAHVAL